jgi:hypothetical protein
MISTVSRVWYSLLVVFGLISFRIFNPIGDEPDFDVKSGLLKSVFFYKYFDLSSDSCKSEYTVFSLFAKLEFDSCFVDLNYFALRIIITLTVVAPLLYSLCMTSGKFARRSPYHFDLSFWHSICILSLFFPSLLYYLGVASVEQLTLVLSLFIIGFCLNFFLVASLWLVIYLLDSGNSLVVLVFLILFYLFMWLRLRLRFGLLGLVLLCLFALFLVAWFRDFIFFVFGDFFNSDRLLYFHEEFYSPGGLYAELIEKHGLLVRLANAFLTFVYMTPSGFKSGFFSFLVFFAIILACIRFGSSKGCVGIPISGFSPRFFLDRSASSTRFFVFLQSGFLAGLCVILFFIILLPTHSNAKYYIFVFPFFLAPFVLAYGFRRVTFFIAFGNISVLVVFIFSLAA